MFRFLTNSFFSSCTGTYNILCCVTQFLVKMYKEESRGLVQPTLVSCSEILDSTMLVVVNDAGIRGPHGD